VGGFEQPLNPLNGLNARCGLYPAHIAQEGQHPSTVGRHQKQKGATPEHPSTLGN